MASTKINNTDKYFVAQTLTPSNYLTTIYARRKGNMVELEFRDLKNMTNGTSVDVYTLPEPYRPLGTTEQTFVTAEATPKVYRMTINTAGVISIIPYYTATGPTNNHSSITYPAWN